MPLQLMNTAFWRVIGEHEVLSSENNPLVQFSQEGMLAFRYDLVGVRADGAQAFGIHARDSAGSRAELIANDNLGGTLAMGEHVSGQIGEMLIVRASAHIAHGIIVGDETPSFTRILEPSGGSLSGSGGDIDGISIEFYDGSEQVVPVTEGLFLVWGLQAQI